jgi:hypothetical protein
MRRLPYQIMLLITLLSTTLFAGWSEPVQLTHRGAEINPKILAINDTLHLIWTQIADTQRVSNIQSIDGGQSWGEIYNLNEWGHGGSFAGLAYNGEIFISAWADYIPFEPSCIAYSFSNNGQSWSLPEYICGNTMPITTPVAVDLSGDSLFAVYFAYGHDSTGNIPFKFLYSSDMGQTWSNEQTVAYAPSYYCNGLLIKKCGGVLYIVWTAIPYPENTTWECQVLISHDGGLTWSPKTFLSQNGGSPAQRACASCNPVDGSFAVGWMDYSYPGRFYIRITSDSGYSWGPEIQNVTDHHISDPAIDFVGDTLWATWTDWNYANYWEIGYSKSTDRGQSWSETERISYTPGNSMTPWLSSDNGKIHLVWQDEDVSTYRDIFYRRWEMGDYITETNKPAAYKLICYPNPFNSKVVINFQDVKGGEIKIYDIAGRLVRVLKLEAKREGSVVWDSRDGLGNSVASGIYIAKAETSKGISVAKLVCLR